MKKDMYQLITDRIIERLEQGEIAWKRPYAASKPLSWKTQKPYRGINALLLNEGEYATFNQIKEAGGKVKKGEKGQQIIFWKLLDGEDKETGKETKIPLLRSYTVFDVAKQTTGLEDKVKPLDTGDSIDNEPVEEAETIIRNYQNAPRLIVEKGTSVPAYYPAKDIVKMPDMKQFLNVESFYSTLFHELVHSTGSKERLNRAGIVKFDAFGTEQYSKEELIAEIGANMLCAEADINNEFTDDNTIAYVQNWIKVLKSDKKFIVEAAQQAQKAVDHILNVKF